MVEQINTNQQDDFEDIVDGKSPPESHSEGDGLVVDGMDDDYGIEITAQNPEDCAFDEIVGCL